MDLSRTSYITFSRKGEKRVNTFLTDVDSTQRAVAIWVTAQYRRLVVHYAGGAPGLGAISSSGYRDEYRGHPTTSDRRPLTSVLGDSSMAHTKQSGYTWFGQYGNLAILNQMKPMYYRRPWGAAGGPNEDKYATQLIIDHKGPPIWAIVEYGAPAHTISPKADRKSLRFIASSGNLAFASKVRHPGSFRDMFWGKNPSTIKNAKSLKGVLNTISVNEPFGRAPFRLSQFIVARSVLNMFNVVLRTANPGRV